MYFYIMSRPLLIFCLFCVIFLGDLTSVDAQNTSDSKQHMNLKQPPYLKAGDTIAIVAPSGILINKNKEIEAAKNLLKKWGLHVVVGAHVFMQADHFAGCDNDRLMDLQSAMENPTIKAIWCARGGYGIVRIIDRLTYSKFKENPKWIIGFSDITALHNQIHNQGIESIHALMCTGLNEDDLPTIDNTLSSFKEALFGKPLRYTLEGASYNKTGQATGQLVGGNLTLLQAMLGSETSIDVSGKILFIEEIGEYKYEIDRMLYSLKRAGYFNQCQGVIVGDMSKLKKNTPSWGASIEKLILNVLSDFDFPIAFNMPAGHEPDNRALILGRQIDLHVEKTQSTINFRN